MNQQGTIRIGALPTPTGCSIRPSGRTSETSIAFSMPGTLVGAPVIEQLEQVAPVTAVSGNVDDGELSVLPSEAVIELAGRRIAIRHILYEGGR